MPFLGYILCFIQYEFHDKQIWSYSTASFDMAEMIWGGGGVDITFKNIPEPSKYKQLCIISSQ